MWEFSLYIRMQIRCADQIIAHCCQGEKARMWLSKIDTNFKSCLHQPSLLPPPTPNTSLTSPSNQNTSSNYPPPPPFHPTAPKSTTSSDSIPPHCTKVHHLIKLHSTPLHQSPPPHQTPFHPTAPKSTTSSNTIPPYCTKVHHLIKLHPTLLHQSPPPHQTPFHPTAPKSTHLIKLHPKHHSTPLHNPPPLHPWPHQHLPLIQTPHQMTFHPVSVHHLTYHHSVPYLILSPLPQPVPQIWTHPLQNQHQWTSAKWFHLQDLSSSVSLITGVDKIQRSTCVGTRDCVIWFILAAHIKTPATNSKQSKSGWLINYSDWFTLACFMFWLCCCWFIAQRLECRIPESHNCGFPSTADFRALTHTHTRSTLLIASLLWNNLDVHQGLVRFWVGRMQPWHRYCSCHDSFCKKELKGDQLRVRESFVSTSWKLSLTVFLQYRKNSFSALDSTLSRSKVRLHKTETGVRTQAQKLELSLIRTSWRRLLSKSLTLGRKTEEGKKKKTFRFAFFF